MKKTLFNKSANDVTHAIQLKLHERMNKKQIWSDCDVIRSQQKSWRRNKKWREGQEKAGNEEKAGREGQ